jgi:hypothetical protein
MKAADGGGSWPGRGPREASVAVRATKNASTAQVAQSLLSNLCSPPTQTRFVERSLIRGDTDLSDGTPWHDMCSATHAHMSKLA